MHTTATPVDQSIRRALTSVDMRLRSYGSCEAGARDTIWGGRVRGGSGGGRWVGVQNKYAKRVRLNFKAKMLNFKTKM